MGRLIASLENYEPRQRQRRADDAAKFHLAVECLACNLVAVSLAAPVRPLAVPLSNAASRSVPIFGKPARKVIDLMVGLQLITKVKGYPYRGPTTIEATTKLHEYLPLGIAQWAALKLEDCVDTVILKPRDSEEPVEDDYAARLGICRITTYVDEVRWLPRVHSEMNAINAAILSAPIECSGSATVHISERPGTAMASLVTLHHRVLRRTFNGTWQEGGRLFGGFWQTMPRLDRFKHIRIGDQPVALVDYGQLFLRLAYAEAGALPPPGDLYDVSGQDASRSGWKQLRNARKRLVNALFFRKAPLKQWPGATIAELAAIRDAFPVGTKPRDAILAIKKKHAPIAHLFERGHGLRFMRIESDLIVAATLAIFAKGAVALPIHDAVLVAERHATAAQRVMQHEAKWLIGADVPADIQTAAG